MNRSASLWSIQAAPKSGCLSKKASGASRPSKIPLLAQRNARVGRSLADLSQVDRAVESTYQMVSLDNVDLDRSMDERIYENYHEAFGCGPKESGARAPSSNLEERVARLMAELEDDDEEEELGETVSRDCVDGDRSRTNSIYEVQKVNIEVSGRPSGDIKMERHHATVIRIEDHSSFESIEARIDEKESAIMENFKEIKGTGAKELKGRLECKDGKDCAEEARKRKEASTIQELRKTWEKQSTDPLLKVLETKQNNSECLISTSNAETSRVARQRREEARRQSKGKHVVGKGTKEIEHLVNFFNCKNAEASREANDLWIKSRPGSNGSANEPITALKKSVDVKSMNDYNGYASDGNCSEDSGHMSNENEVEWKESIQNESAVFGKERFFEQNEMRNIGVFNTAIVNRLETDKKTVVVAAGVPTAAARAGSIVSKGETAKIAESIGKGQWKTCRTYNDEGQVQTHFIESLKTNVSRKINTLFC